MTPRPRPPAAFWQAVAVGAALCAAVTLALHPNAQFVAAGVIAVAAAGAAQWEALVRRQGRSSDIGGLITAVFAVDFFLVCLLGLAARGWLG